MVGSADRSGSKRCRHSSAAVVAAAAEAARVHHRTRRTLTSDSSFDFQASGNPVMADKDESEKTIAEDLVVTKYKMAGDIVNRKFERFVP